MEAVYGRADIVVLLLFFAVVIDVVLPRPPSKITPLTAVLVTSKRVVFLATTELEVFIRSLVSLRMKLALVGRSEKTAII